jgi:hypothetical protein
LVFPVTGDPWQSDHPAVNFNPVVVVLRGICLPNGLRQVHGRANLNRQSTD